MNHPGVFDVIITRCGLLAHRVKINVETRRRQARLLDTRGV